MPPFGEGAAFARAILEQRSMQPMPAAENPAEAKALINFLMQDRLFLALFRSNDAKVRATAMDSLNEVHRQAYGGAPTKEDALA
jgi:hypothetical protein